ncbi:MAG: LytTR family transcriptional regulator [Nitrospirae bacterium]|nr:LytTR family transcriptional regulator [Nitrospirota bacterium]MCL5238112.1 LytTR family transcriptional regulator [Nitrospirota bacterium]
MQILKDCLNVGLVLLSSDFCVIGMNKLASQMLGPAMEELGKSVFHYHPRKSHSKIKCLLSESRVHPNIPTTMVIDVLNKALIINVSEVALKKPWKPLFAMTFVDITDQVGAETNPDTGMMELKKFPICSKGSLRFLDMQSIYFIRSDANYCRIFTETGSYHLQFTLKNILKRYAGLKFFRVHKSFIVNIDHIRRVERDPRGHTAIIFDRETIPHVPVARRKLHELKNILEPLTK